MPLRMIPGGVCFKIGSYSFAFFNGDTSSAIIFITKPVKKATDVFLSFLRRKFFPSLHMFVINAKSSIRNLQTDGANAILSIQNFKPS